jgi:NAD(P)-dependent dehydrogenase (short-subunit alcohol dehydrogenase family)
MNNIDLRGHRAVITGGAQGIGRAIAERFLDSGAELSLWDADENLVRATSHTLSATREVHFCAVDVADAKAVETATGQTLQALGKIDILVANAGDHRTQRKAVGVSSRCVAASDGRESARCVSLLQGDCASDDSTKLRADRQSIIDCRQRMKPERVRL